MIYLSGAVRDELLSIPNVGFMLTPRMGNGAEAAAKAPFFGMDNGCFTQPHLYDEAAYLDWIAERPGGLFATAPDVVGDAELTLERSIPVLPMIREAGAPAALVAQDGLEELAHLIPWSELDCLFVGGSTDWKLSEESGELMREARARGKHVHVGRVNSLRRMRWSRDNGAHSADGTFVSFAPRQNVERVRGWMDELELEDALAFQSPAELVELEAA